MSEEKRGQPTSSRLRSSSKVNSSQRASKQTGKELVQNTVLYLKQNHVKFNTPSRRESVFFDECNREIISLTSGIEIPGEQKLKTKVVFQSTDCDRDPKRLEFILPIEKRLLSIKLNSSRSILAYHVEKNIIEFLNVKESLVANGQPSYRLDEKRYVQASRAKNSKLIGFLWTGPSELVIVTDLSVEYYHVDANRRKLKHVKLFQSAVNWFVYQPIVDRVDHKQTSETIYDQHHQKHGEHPYSILMVSTGSSGNSMQPYMFERGQITRLQRFDVEGDWHDSEKLELFERSITIAHIYGHVRLLVLQHESLNLKSRGAQIVLYTVDPVSGVTSKTHTLDLDVGGRFAINILDNLVIAHNQPSKSSFIFDIMIESTEKSDCPDHFVSLIDSRPIRQLKLATTQGTSSGDSKAVEMYSLNWVFFQPNFIVDAKMGLLSTVELDLPAIQDFIQDDLALLTFLSYRRDSAAMIFQKCKQIIAESCALVTGPPDGNRQVNPLADVSSAFEIIGRLIVSAPELEPSRITPTSNKRSSLTRPRGQPEATSQVTPARDTYFGPLLYQEDIQREVLRFMADMQSEEQALFHFISSTYLELIFTIRRLGKNVDCCIYELLLKCLIDWKRYFQITQMIRSDILKDSKQLACLLLSLRSQYKPAGQLGLDMFQRLDCLTNLVEAIDLDSASSRSSQIFGLSVETEVT